MKETGDDFEGEDEEAAETGPPSAIATRARAYRSDNATLGRIAHPLARIDETEDLLATGASPRRVAGALARKWGVGRRQALAYVYAVQSRWIRDGQEDRERKRDRMRAMMLRTYQMAMERQRAVVVNTGDFLQKIEMVTDPDFRSATTLIDLMCRFDGLMEQQESSGTVTPQALLVALHNHYYGDAGPPEVTAKVLDVKAEGADE